MGKIVIDTATLACVFGVLIMFGLSCFYSGQRYAYLERQTMVDECLQQDKKPVIIYVATMQGCAPCERLKHDLNSCGLDKYVRLEFIDKDDPRFTEIFGNKVKQFPTAYVVRLVDGQPDFESKHYYAYTLDSVLDAITLLRNTDESN